MLLAIDIGNTNLVIGCFENDKILFKARIATDHTRTSDQYGVEIKSMLEAYGARISDIDDCIISSVVPPVFNSVRTGVMKVIGKQPMVVGPGLKTGLNIHVDVPSQVGSDRIVIAVAALAEYQAPLILMDLGTATTIEVVEPENVYMGGVIFPGVRVSLDALTSRAAQLPGISLDKPKQVIGKNTVYDLPNLEEIVISEGTTTVEDYAFESCPSLKRVYVPQSVTNFSKDALYRCPDDVEILRVSTGIHHVTM